MNARALTSVGAATLQIGLAGNEVCIRKPSFGVLDDLTESQRWAVMAANREDPECALMLCVALCDLRGIKWIWPDLSALENTPSDLVSSSSSLLCPN